MNGNDNIPHLFLDTLSKTKDFDQSLSQLLEKAGEFYQLRFIRIRERPTLEFKLETTYEWCHDKADSSHYQTFPMTKEIWNKMAEEFYDERFIFSTSTATGIPAFFRAALYDKQMVGIIEIEKQNAQQPWTPENIQSLKCISNIISNALLKNRAFRQAESAISKITQFDMVTGLFTYPAFCIEANHTIHSPIRKKRMAVLYGDIINFKYLNDTYGPSEGDKLLRAFAHYLKRSPRNICATRIFSDTFVMLTLLDDTSNPISIHNRIGNIINHFLETQRILYPRCNLEIACGFCEIDDPSADIVHFVDKANAARKDLKARFGAGVSIFTQDLEKQLQRENDLLNAIPGAFLNHEFFFVLQPKVALDTGKIAGAEALVRWKKNDGTLLPPMDFIPLLEKTDEITHLDFYVYESVCRYLHERLNKKLVTVPISVNVSRRHLKNHLFIEQIKSLTSQYEIPPALLEFELTETLFLENSDEAILLQKNLHQAGFTLSLDDFGSGFSSLNLLKKMTLDVIKIDRSFLEGNVINSVDKTIIRCIIHMAKLLNITVLCEGAETLEQVQYLRKARCSMVQGFYFSKPLSIEKMNDLLDSGKIYSIPYALKNPVPH